MFRGCEVGSDDVMAVGCATGFLMYACERVKGLESATPPGGGPYQPHSVSRSKESLY